MWFQNRRAKWRKREKLQSHAQTATSPVQQSPDIGLQTFSVPVSTVQMSPAKQSLPQAPVESASAHSLVKVSTTDSRTSPLVSTVIGTGGGNIQLIATAGAQSWPTTVLPITYIPTTLSTGGTVLTPQILTSPARLPIIAGSSQIMGVSPAGSSQIMGVSPQLGGMPQFITLNQFPGGATPAAAGGSAQTAIPMIIQIPTTVQSSPTTTKDGSTAS